MKHPSIDCIPKFTPLLKLGFKGSNRLETLQNKVHDTVLEYAKKYGTDDEDDHIKLATEMDNVIATARWASGNGNRDTANQLIVTLTQAGNFIQEYGYLYELLTLRAFSSGFRDAFPAYQEETDEVEELERILEAAEADDDEELDFDIEDDELEEDEEDESIFSIPSTLDTATLPNIDIDVLRTALNAARQQKDIIRQIQVLKALGKVQIFQSRETEAIATYNDLLSAYESVEDNEGTLETLDMLSGLLTRTDNSQAAILNATRGIQLAEKLDDDDTRMHLHITVGDARQNLGESKEAIQAFAKALEIARTRDDAQNEAIILYKLGYAYLDNGDTETAITTLEQARDLFKSQEKRDYEGRVLGGLGAAYSELERWSEAINYHNSALYIAREVEDREEEALQLSNLGQALVQTNKLPEALTRYRQALHLAYEGGNRDNIVSAIVDLVRLMMRSARLLDISNLLIDDAVALEPADRDVISLKERIEAEKQVADLKGTQQAPINGTAKDYAENAYTMMDV